MIRTLVHLALFFSLPAFVRSVSADEVVVESPAADSRVKLFEFPGGTPEQFVAALKKTYGDFGLPVTMTDDTGGVPLPAARVFASDASFAAQQALKDRLQMRQNGNEWLKLRFVTEAGPPRSTKTAEESGQADADKTVLFHFPGGSPAELIAALDAAFGCQLSQVATVSPEVAAIRIPRLGMRAGDACEVVAMLNDFSQQSAGSVGCWRTAGRDQVLSNTTAETDVLMVTPLYNEDNPSPAIAARDAASSREMRELAGQQKKVAALEAALTQANQALDQLREQLKKLEAKAP